ncbi:TetR/AcrR family transcriptional regulator [Bradyrhizobium sp. WD16]|uniref:TetR/AcrR family transcriptional regulator n=1 Tax=Bradyrhizobium sp. WD16 TaxID=1521768 RepID=UPI0020A37765|nr:TetR/AcrR family transcriptional regulator [Bradyrhizobium sp. WD16]UTD27268.1 TetR family transcriptional regulator [Bradyrhizobium sp. WD16]
MVQKRIGRPPEVAPQPAGEAPAARKRGRPRAFAAEVALGRALDTFRDSGFAATTLDDLSAAMGINRPSLYGAFGDKRELFLKAYARYREEAEARFAPVFEPQRSLREALELLFATALDFYLEGDNGPRGCFTVMTAGSEAMTDAEIRATVQRAISGTDKALTGLFSAAVARGELTADSDVPALVQLVGSTIHTIALRARARFPRAELEAITRRTVDLACAGALRDA